jgi:hypothetical protein
VKRYVLLEWEMFRRLCTDGKQILCNDKTCCEGNCAILATHDAGPLLEAAERASYPCLDTERAKLAAELRKIKGE